ncbi:MAG TPA: hypothetical protein V6D10_14675 [Trichocoleus sp.]
MRLFLSRLAIVITTLALSTATVQAQSESQVRAMVEALRQAAPQTGQADDGLYSPWQVQAQNIPRWSRSCIGREISPSEFEASPEVARDVVTCVVQDVLREETGKSNEEATAVRRVAAWWMTGDPDRFNSGDTATYTARVLSFYQQQNGTAASSAAASPPTATAPAPASSPTAAPPIFDRYMSAGYRATEQRDYDAALTYFKRALDERPNDPYAQRAIENVDRYRAGRQQSNSPEAQ